MDWKLTEKYDNISVAISGNNYSQDNSPAHSSNMRGISKPNDKLVILVLSLPHCNMVSMIHLFLVYFSIENFIEK